MKKQNVIKELKGSIYRLSFIAFIHSIFVSYMITRELKYCGMCSIVIFGIFLFFRLVKEDILDRMSIWGAFIITTFMGLLFLFLLGFIVMPIMILRLFIIVYLCF